MVAPQIVAKLDLLTRNFLKSCELFECKGVLASKNGYEIKVSGAIRKFENDRSFLDWENTS